MGRSAALAAVLVSVAGSALSQTAGPDSRFNLLCTGEMKTLAPALLNSETAPYSQVYRIDLKAKRWCSGECLAQRDLITVSPTLLLLEEKKVDTPREHETVHNEISRVTGAHLAMAESGPGRSGIAIFWNGRCEKAAFTGFPEVATKF